MDLHNGPRIGAVEYAKDPEKVLDTVLTDDVQVLVGVGATALLSVGTGTVETTVDVRGDSVVNTPGVCGISGGSLTDNSVGSDLCAMSEGTDPTVLSSSDSEVLDCNSRGTLRMLSAPRGTRDDAREDLYERASTNAVEDSLDV